MYVYWKLGFSMNHSLHLSFCQVCHIQHSITLFLGACYGLNHERDIKKSTKLKTLPLPKQMNKINTNLRFFSLSKYDSRLTRLHSNHANKGFSYFTLNKEAVVLGDKVKHEKWRWEWVHTMWSVYRISFQKHLCTYVFHSPW